MGPPARARATRTDVLFSNLYVCANRPICAQKVVQTGISPLRQPTAAQLLSECLGHSGSKASGGRCFKFLSRNFMGDLLRHGAPNLGAESGVSGRTRLLPGTLVHALVVLHNILLAGHEISHDR